MKKNIFTEIQKGNKKFFILLTLFAAASAYFNYYLSALEFAIVILIYLLTKNSAIKSQAELIKFIDSTIYNVDTATSSSIINFPFPMAVLNSDDSTIIWCNDAFYEITGKKHLFSESIKSVFKEIDLDDVADTRGEYTRPVKVNGRIFSIYLTKAEKHTQANDLKITTVYLIDRSDYHKIKEQFDSNKVVCAIITVDNYDELTKSASDALKSSIISKIDEKLNQWVLKENGLIRRYDRDKYLVILNEQTYQQYHAKKFDIMDSIREITDENQTPFTISIGIGRGGETINEALNFANFAIDMALSRGGDQVVVKNPKNFEFFGGRTREFEKRTKVKSRVMANTLTAMIKDSTKVFIMGHKGSDLDSIGSAAGICCMARKLSVKAYIITDQASSSAASLIQRLSETEEYKGIFINAQRAIIEADAQTLMIIADTNKTSYVENEDLLLSMNKVAVIDHHRQAVDHIENAALNFYEPYASSTCEMVTELLQYCTEPSEILKVEADALLSGISLDTKNFTIKAGVRTFEAAAFLRKAGAETMEVKKLFQSSFTEYKNQLNVAMNTEIYKDIIAIAVYNGETSKQSAAQAADTMLNIIGIQASFVIYQNNKKTCISGRSLGQINVQIVLEVLGGGGHLTMAGTQFDNKSTNEALRLLKEQIDTYLEQEKK